MANLVALIPTKILFPLIFGVLPVVLTIRVKGIENLNTKEWVSFALLLLGAVMTYVLSTTTDTGAMHTTLWPLLALMGIGLLVYRQSLAERGEWDESKIQRGGASYDD